MTDIVVDIRNVASQIRPDDRIYVWAPNLRERTGGGLVSTAPHEVRLIDGQATITGVEPGPLMIRFECMGISDTGDKQGVVPEDEESVDVFDVLADSLIYPAPVIGAAQAARNEALQAAQDVHLLAEATQEAAQDTADNAEQASIDRGIALVSRQRAEAAAWKAELTTVGVNVIENPVGSGLWAIGADTLEIFESEPDSGLYVIGVRDDEPAFS